METTIVTILKREKAGYEKAGALCDVKLRFLTDEKEERFLRMEIEPISNKMMFLFVTTFHNQEFFDRAIVNLEPKNWHLNSKA